MRIKQGLICNRMRIKQGLLCNRRIPKKIYFKPEIEREFSILEIIKY